MAVAAPPAMQVGVQVVGQIFVRGCQQGADAGASDEFAQVESEDSCQRAVEQGGEFVGKEERRARRLFPSRKRSRPCFPTSPQPLRPPTPPPPPPLHPP